MRLRREQDRLRRPRTEIWGSPTGKRTGTSKEAEEEEPGRQEGVQSWRSGEEAEL